MSNTNVDQTLAQRQNVHGDFSDNSRLTIEFMKVAESGKNWRELLPVQQTALFHIQHKISRILSGDPNFADHWHDIGGYAKCVEERLDGPMFVKPATPIPTFFCHRCVQDFPGYNFCPNCSLQNVAKNKA